VQQRALGICERELHDVFGGYFELTLPIDYEALRAVAQVQAEAHEQAKTMRGRGGRRGQRRR